MPYLLSRRLFVLEQHVAVIISMMRDNLFTFRSHYHVTYYIKTTIYVVFKQTVIFTHTQKKTLKREE